MKDKTTNKKENTLPSILSFQRCIIVTDAILKNRDESGNISPVKVVEHGIRGTQNQQGENTEVGNPIITQSAKTLPDAVGLNISTAIRFLPVKGALFSCAGTGQDQLREELNSFIDRAEDGLREVARRYARNILSGRWTWRNRILGASMSVEVKTGDETIEVDAHHIPRGFPDLGADDYSEEEVRLGEIIYKGLAGHEAHTLEVTAKISFGFKGAVEVYPSQNMVLKKPEKADRNGNNLPSRSLYRLQRPLRTHDREGYDGGFVVGDAALRDQKISNAIRTVDTWYGDEAAEVGPIPVEPKGANLELNKFFRTGESSSFSILKRLKDTHPASPDGLFLLACIVRGGVYAGSEKNSGAN